MKIAALILLAGSLVANAQTNISVTSASTVTGGAVLFKTSIGEIHINGMPQSQTVHLLEVGKLEARIESLERQLATAKAEKLQANRELGGKNEDEVLVDRYNKANTRVQLLDEDLDASREALKKLRQKSAMYKKACMLLGVGISFLTYAYGIWNCKVFLIILH